MKLIPILVALSSTLAHATGATDCHAALGVPPKFAKQFRVYKNHRYLTPLAVTAFENNGRYLRLRLEGWVNPEIIGGKTPPYAELKCRLVRNGGLLNLEMCHAKYSDYLPPEYVYRVLLAHLLDKVRDVRQVGFLYTSTDLAQVRERLLRGATPKASIEASAVFRAFRAFDFALLPNMEVAAIVDDERAYLGQAGAYVEFVHQPCRPVRVLRPSF